MKNGQFQIYTGFGKGKTTAAIGLAVRAIGAGCKVYMGQFIKDMLYHEIEVLRSLPNITIDLYGSGDGCFINAREIKEADLLASKAGVDRIITALSSKEYDLVIADEINVAASLGLVSTMDMKEIISAKHEGVELVFTGISCPDEILDMADLVTEMKEIRHYYKTKGITSRDGIER